MTYYKSHIRDKQGNSLQEILIKKLSNLIVGESSVFLPYLYGFNEKIQTDEAADLVWHFEDVVILFYMTATEKTFDDQDIIYSKSKKQINHNLEQARKFINHWKSGKVNIKGSNTFQEFDIKYSGDLKTIILSVFHVGTKDGYIETDFMKKHDIHLCVSFSNDFFDKASSTSFTPLDICVLIHEILKNGKNSNDKLGFNTEDSVLAYYNNSLNKALLAALNHNMATTVNTLTESLSLLHQWRLPGLNQHSQADNFKSSQFLTRFFNDLAMSDLAFAAMLIGMLTQRNIENINNYALVAIPFDHYVFILSVNNARFDTYQDMVDLAIKDAISTGKAYSVLFRFPVSPGIFSDTFMLDNTKPLYISTKLSEIKALVDKE
jgi:hypothetical protein